MAKGIIRKLDDLGRITLPIEIRRRFELKDGDRVGLRLDGQVIRVSKSVAGMSRPLDNLGRVVIPKEYRRTLGIADGTPVDMYVEDGEICIKKESKVCVICGRTGELFDLYPVKEVLICKSCALAVTDMVMEKGL